MPRMHYWRRWTDASWRRVPLAADPCLPQQRQEASGLSDATTAALLRACSERDRARAERDDAELARTRAELARSAAERDGSIAVAALEHLREDVIFMQEQVLSSRLYLAELVESLHAELSALRSASSPAAALEELNRSVRASDAPGFGPAAASIGQTQSQVRLA